ncbi:MAG: 16S rRNA (uracil(1498)-N(3))-methyltransferase [Candidatus Krumholzibacteriota bacterium]|nr:16S rRNA (uracil(1498)-N(3))-methyltransferase [Candidatus Krumholzibacteriota bacterium]
MSVTRYFIIPGDTARTGNITLTGSEAHHLSRVIRAAKGDIVLLLDGQGSVIEASILSIEDSAVLLGITSTRKVARDGNVDIAISLIKTGRMDLAVEKMAELGVRRIIPVVCERTVWKDRGGGEDRKRERLLRKAVSACKQSGQPYFPVIENTKRLDELIRIMPDYSEIFLADSEGNEKPSPAHNSREKGVLGIIGPEGGFSDDERALLVSSGASGISLGSSRLRTETAAICLAYELLVSSR